jgi:hypothetical protein
VPVTLFYVPKAIDAKRIERMIASLMGMDIRPPLKKVAYEIYHSARGASIMSGKNV